MKEKGERQKPLRFKQTT